MKHYDKGGCRKVFKQLSNCPEIYRIKSTQSGYMIMACNGEQYLVHFSDRAYHPLRRWLKNNTSLKSLKF